MHTIWREKRKNPSLAKAVTQANLTVSQKPRGHPVHMLSLSQIDRRGLQENIKMNKEHEKITQDYIRISSDTRNKLTTLSAVVIVSIYFFSTPANAVILKTALLFYFLTILGEIIAGFFKSKHYSLWFDEKIDTIDYKESIYGRIADWLFWVPSITFTIASIFFMVGLFV